MRSTRSSGQSCLNRTMGVETCISIGILVLIWWMVLAKKLAKTRFDRLGPWQEQLANLRFKIKSARQAERAAYILHSPYGTHSNNK